MKARTTSRRAQPSPSFAEVAVEDVMHIGFVGCALETPLRSVATLMAEHHVHCLVGFGDQADDDTRLWGVVSDIDVVAALAAGADGVTAGEISTSEAVTIAPHETVRHAAELMRDHEVSHVLVVDGVSDRPVGVVSTLDVMELAAVSI